MDVKKYRSLVIARRKERGWSQTKLAQHAELHRSTVSKFEKGQAFDPATEEKISKALGITEKCDRIERVSAKFYFDKDALEAARASGDILSDVLSNCLRERYLPVSLEHHSHFNPGTQEQREDRRHRSTSG